MRTADRLEAQSITKEQVLIGLQHRSERKLNWKGGNTRSAEETRFFNTGTLAAVCSISDCKKEITELAPLPHWDLVNCLVDSAQARKQSGLARTALRLESKVRGLARTAPRLESKVWLW